MVVNRFDENSSYVAGICRQFAELSGHAAVGNAYATQGGSGTFGKHWDTHCVFVTQLIGAKRWKVYRPTMELPLKFHNSRNQKNTFAGEVVFEADLQEGDILYIPRGWWHEVMPINNVPSLHIAVGIHSVKVHDYIRWVLGSKMPSHKICRETLALDVNRDSFNSALQTFSEICMDPEVIGDFVRQHHGVVGMKLFVNFSDIFETPSR